MTRPGMCDGRCFTTYIPNEALDSNIKKKNSIQKDSTYRNFIQHNANPLMHNLANISFSQDDAECNSVSVPSKQSMEKLVKSSPSPYNTINTSPQMFSSIL